MNLELKQIKLGIHSEETLDYKATLFINGVAVAYVSNTGQGGMTDIHHIDGKYKALIQEAEAYVKAMPPVPSEFFPEGLNWTLDFWCDDQAEKECNRRETNKIVKRREKKELVIQNSKGDIFTRGWKGIGIEEMVKEARSSPKAKEALTGAITKAKKEGFKILNTNIPEEFL